MSTNPNKIISLQELIDAQVDAYKLEQIMNEAAWVEITTRLGRKCYSILTINAIIEQYKQLANSEIANLTDAINVALAAGAGAAGWTASLVVDGDKNQKQINAAQALKNQQIVDISDFGAIGDGIYHPLSEKYSTLALAKFAYANIAERITSLNQSIDWAACQSAIVANQTVYALAKTYVLTDTILIPDGCSLIGRGVDYWDSYRPNPTELPKSDRNGTHFYFYGQGAKVHYIDDIANTLPPKSKDGVSYELTHFTNRDATAAISATPRMFSVGIKVGKNSNLEGCRAIPYYNGLQGYIDGTGLSDEWDVGVWVVSANDCQVDNVQAVGHWRMCGVLLTEHQDKSEGKRNPERCNFNRVWGSGVRGLIARNTPQYEVTASTDTTVSIKFNNTCTIQNTNKFKTSSGTTHTYTSSSLVGDVLTLSGVSPNLVAAPTTLRAWNTGNNFSNTIFQNCIFSSLDHVSGKKSTELGLPVSGAAEFDGYPMRNLVFINTAFQTTFDKLNTIWGNCYDFKFVACKHENGQKIAYSDSETKMFTMNLRMIAQDVATEGWELFTPRSGFNDSLQIPQTFTDGTLSIQPLPTKALRLKDQAGNDVLVIAPSGALSTSGTLTVANNLVVFGTLRGNITRGSSLGSATFRFNKAWLSTANIDQLPVHVDNTSAKSGGLIEGDLYRTGAGQLMVCY